MLTRSGSSNADIVVQFIGFGLLSEPISFVCIQSTMVVDHSVEDGWDLGASP